MIWQSAVSAHVWKLNLKSMPSMPANDVNQCIEAFWPKFTQLRSSRLFQLWSKSYCNCSSIQQILSVYERLHALKSLHIGDGGSEFGSSSRRATFTFLFTISYTHCSKKTWKTQASRLVTFRWILNMKMLAVSSVGVGVVAAFFLPFRNLSHSRAYELNIVVERRI